MSPSDNWERTVAVSAMRRSGFTLVELLAVIAITGQPSGMSGFTSPVSSSPLS